MNDTQNILIVDGDLEIRELLVKRLTAYGYAAVAVDCGKAMREELASGAYALIILDIMLRGEAGLALCREVRAAHAAYKHNPLLQLGVRLDGENWLKITQPLYQSAAWLIWIQRRVFLAEFASFAVLVLVLLRRLLKPFQQLTEAAERIGKQPEFCSPLAGRGLQGNSGGGTLTLTNRPEGGLCARITLPRLERV